MSAEPEQLKRGKRFQEAVQEDWQETADGNPTSELTIRLLHGVTPSGRRRRGRMDIFVDELGEVVVVVEIKATDWDRILPGNVQRNLASHRRQVWKYIEKYVDGEQVDVCAGIIYPTAPQAVGLKDRIESYLNDYGLQVVWYYD